MVQTLQAPTVKKLINPPNHSADYASNHKTPFVVEGILRVSKLDLISYSGILPIL